MMGTKQYVAEIKEVGNNSVLTSSHTGREMTQVSERTNRPIGEIRWGIFFLKMQGN